MVFGCKRIIVLFRNVFLTEHIQLFDMAPKLTILLVDDHKMTCEGLADSLLSLPKVKEVFTAFNSKDAFALLAQHQFDLALLDIELNEAESNGFDICKHIKTKKCKTVVAMVSMFHSDDTVEEAKENGANAYFGKNVELEVLKSFIEKMKGLPQQCFIDGRAKKVVTEVAVTEVVPVEVEQLKVCKRLTFKCEGERHYFEYDDIVWIEASKSQSVIYTKGDVHEERVVVSKRLGVIEEMLPDYLFFRTHKRWMVNMKYVKTQKRVDGLRLRMYNDVLIPIGRDRVKAVDEALYYFDKDGGVVKG